MDEKREQFAALLKQYRKDNGLSQRGLARKLGVSQPTIVQYENGKMLPSEDTHEKLLKIIKCDRELIPKRKHFHNWNVEMTDEEREFATKNHGLVYSYLNYRHLSYDDWYDIVIFRYLHAVQKWFRREELHKYSFSTIAFMEMRTAVSNELKRHHFDTVSLDAVIPGTENFTYADMLCDPRDCVGI